MTSSVHQLTWPAAVYNHVRSKTTFRFDLNATVPCDFSFHLRNSDLNHNFEVTVPKFSKSFSTDVLWPDFEDGTALGYRAGELNLAVVDAVNRTIWCDSGTEAHIVGVGQQMVSPKIKLFYYSSSFLHLLSSTIGWLYFLAWSVSFYPQVVLNYRRKSTTGLNLDFVVLNIIGFVCYSIYNVGLYFDQEILAQYFYKHPENLEPVRLDDVIFAIHALLLSCVTLAQVLLYSEDRSFKFFFRQLTSLSKVFLALAVFYMAVVLCQTRSNLEIIFSVSYIKVAVTLIKYIPQAVQNYLRKSTSGWSIYQVLLDVTGGSFSILQMVLDNWNYQSRSYNPAKLALGGISLVFDFVFIVQHYVLYRHRRRRSEDEEGLIVDV